MPANRRIPGLDLVRCAAIFLVVLQHSWTMLDLDLLAGTVQHYVYSSVIYGVPLFVMLSGALNLRRVEGVREFYRKRFLRVVVPFLIWGTFTYAMSAMMGKYAEIDSISSALRMYVPYILTGKINEAYWFVYLILALYLATPLLQRVFCRDSRFSVTAMLLSVALCLGIEVLLPCPALIGIFIKYLAYYILGSLVLRLLPESGTRLLSGGAGTVVFLALNVWLRSRGQDLAFVNAAEIISVFLLFSGIDSESGLTYNLSRYSFLVYLTHFIIIRAMYVGLPQIFVPVWYMPVVAAILTIGVEYVFCLALEKFNRFPLKFLGI